MNSNIFEEVYNNNIEKVKDLLERGEDPNKWEEEGVTPICYSRTPEMIDLLISYGADINAKGEHGWTPLFQAIAFRNVDTVNYLLKRGADRSISTEFKETMISFLQARIESTSEEIKRCQGILKILTDLND